MDRAVLAAAASTRLLDHVGRRRCRRRSAGATAVMAVLGSSTACHASVSPPRSGLSSRLAEGQRSRAASRPRAAASPCRRCAAGRRSRRRGSWRSLRAGRARRRRRRPRRTARAPRARCSSRRSRWRAPSACAACGALSVPRKNCALPRGRGRDQRAPVLLALEHRQAVVVRPDAAGEDRVAVVEQVVRGDRRRRAAAAPRRTYCARLARGDVLEHDLQARESRAAAASAARSMKTASRSKTSTSGSVTSPCTSSSRPSRCIASSVAVGLAQVGDAGVAVGGGAGRIELDRDDAGRRAPRRSRRAACCR